MKAYIGFDTREREAYRVAMETLQKTSGIIAEPIRGDKLRSHGLITRMVDERNGQPYDLPSNAPCSTEFASNRFLVPILCQSGFALFTDCDVVFLSDVKKMLEEVDESKAVSVVKHNNTTERLDVTTCTDSHKRYLITKKMCGLEQTVYPRKNWSSVMLFNCDHPANRRLTVHDVNYRPGRDLHGFYWLDDSDIGELDPSWNWLVNVNEKPERPKIAHFTLGGPWIENWQPAQYDDIWLSEAGWCYDTSKYGNLK